MDAQLVVVVAGVILVAAIIGSLVFLRGYSGRFTYDTKNGTTPKASEGEGNTPGVAFKGRFTLLTVGIGAMFTALVTKLWSMQMVSSDYYENLAQTNQTRTVTTAAPRGRILDRNGVALVTNRASLAVTAYRDLADDTLLVRHLANVLGMPYVAVLRNIQDNTEGAQARHTIATDVRRSTVAYIQEHAGEFNGVTVDERTERQYPYGTTACHVLGYTSTITQEQLDAQSEDGDSAGTIDYQSGDVVGQAGVESRYERLLQGIRGEQTVTVDAQGNVLGQAGSVPASPGSDIKLTLDLTIQQACETGLQHAIDTAKNAGYENAGNGACLCLDCTNGEILGMASAPTFSPSSFVGGISTADWDALQAEGSNYPMLNRAIAGQYAPGSVIKPLTSFAALDKGIATPQSSWYCTGWWTWSGNQSDTAGMRCWKRSGHGAIGLSGGITYSCDVVFYEIGKGFYYSETDPEGMQETFRRYGLGSATGIDLPGEEVGRVPDAQWKWDHYKSMGYSDEDCTWQGGENANLAIGQGDLLVTSLQMATAYCSIANGGPVWRPHLMRGVRSRIGDGLVSEYRCEQLSNVEEDVGFRDVVAAGMQGVVYEEDPAQTSHWTNLDVTVRGKTGTAEQTASDRSVCWFGAYAPADDPKYVVFSNVDGGSGGGATAMLVVRDVFGQIYGQPDTSTVPVAGID